MADERVKQAHVTYQKGEKAATVQERQDSFNQALHLYEQLASEYPTPSGQGRLYYNIANSYFQLEQYPWAVLYYYKALKANTKDENAQRNLQVALGKLGLPPPPSVGWGGSLVKGLSLTERWQLMAALVAIAGILASLYLWRQELVWKYGAIVVALAAGVCLLSITYSAWFTEVEVVVLRSTFLYRGAGKQYAKVLDNPLSPGIKLYLNDLEPEAPWAKVTTSQGETGFIPVDRLGTI
jgi:tetratricopeptide (TPR) repeat protein